MPRFVFFDCFVFDTVFAIDVITLLDVPQELKKSEARRATREVAPHKVAEAGRPSRVMEAEAPKDPTGHEDERTAEPTPAHSRSGG